MIKRFMLLAVTTMLVACSHDLWILDYFFPLKASEQTMMTKTDIAVKSISLTAREERKLPSGLKPSRDRDIGFASVVVEFENTSTEKSAIVRIQRIEVRNALLGNIQLSSQAPTQIALRPMEISAHQVELTNKTGYSGFGKVKAIITYQVGNNTRKIESQTVDIQRD